MLNALRNVVSAEKKRYNIDGFDLDLTYITDRIIAMAYPADGVEKAYRNDINKVAEMLRQKHPDHFLIFNLSQRPYNVAKFGGPERVRDIGWPDHHAPPLFLLFKIVKEIHTFLTSSAKNVVVAHCLAGKGRTGTVIASYLIFSGLFDNADDALSYFACRRSSNNWGVTNPGQKRAVEYFARVLKEGNRPKDEPLMLTSVVMNKVPRFAVGATRKPGITPILHVYDCSVVTASSHGGTLLWTNRMFKPEKSFHVNQNNLVFHINTLISGDVLVTLDHASVYGYSHIARSPFHTGMISREDLYLRFNKADLDDALNDSRFPEDFCFEIYFEEIEMENNSYFMQNQARIETENSLWSSIFPIKEIRNGELCFWADDELYDKIKMARQLVIKTGQSIVEKAGYLTKLGHKVKNWKRRWFVLREDKLCYYKKPKDLSPCGVINLNSITAVKEYSDNEPHGDFSSKPNCFSIFTTCDVYLCSADNEREREEWIEFIDTARRLKDKLNLLSEPLLPNFGLISITLVKAVLEESSSKTNFAKSQSLDCYVTLSILDRTIKTTPLKFSPTMKFPRETHIFELHSFNQNLHICIWHSKRLLSDELVGEAVVIMKPFEKFPQNKTIQQEYSIKKKNAVCGQLIARLEYFPSHDKEKPNQDEDGEFNPNHIKNHSPSRERSGFSKFGLPIPIRDEHPRILRANAVVTKESGPVAEHLLDNAIENKSQVETPASELFKCSPGILFGTEHEILGEPNATSRGSSTSETPKVQPKKTFHLSSSVKKVYEQEGLSKQAWRRRSAVVTSRRVGAYQNTRNPLIGTLRSDQRRAKILGSGRKSFSSSDVKKKGLMVEGSKSDDSSGNDLQQQQLQERKNT